MTQTVQAQIAYFGKIPSRGDFVKSPHNPQLLQTLDRWIAQAMELLADDPRDRHRGITRRGARLDFLVDALAGRHAAHHVVLGAAFQRQGVLRGGGEHPVLGLEFLGGRVAERRLHGIEPGVGR
ncbi:type VI secretion system-associated protein TagF, partial [Burkholderia gladioli]|nr:type VI secretion system-associated protein TagF [Burkholderia gladioli]